MPARDAEAYAARVEAGEPTLVVRVSADQVAAARAALDRAGAVDGYFGQGAVGRVTVNPDSVAPITREVGEGASRAEVIPELSGRADTLEPNPDAKRLR